MLRFSGVVFGLIGAVTFSLVKLDPEGNLDIWVLVALAGPVLVSVGNIFRTVFMPKDIHPGILAAGMTLLGAATLFVLNIGLGIELAPASFSAPAIFLLAGQMAVFAVLYDLYFLLQKTAGRFTSVKSVLYRRLLVLDWRLFYSKKCQPCGISSQLCLLLLVSFL